MSFNFTLSEELKQVRASAEKMVRKFDPVIEQMRHDMHVNRRFPQELWDAAAEAGFLGALVPEEYGGTNIGITAMGVATETMTSNGLGNVLFVLTPMDALCILRHGSEEMKKEFLPQICAGKLKFCFAITEPDAGSNTFRITTQAKKDGDDYVITGQKTFITGADVADYMLLVTRTTPYEELKTKNLPKTAGFSLFIVPTNAKGLEKRRIPTHGIEGMNQYTLFFDGVRVPKRSLVGLHDQGFLPMFEALNPERILAAFSAAGSIDFLLAKAVKYAKDRSVFGGKPIGGYQGIQHPLAEIKIEAEAMRLMAYKAAWAYDSKLPPTEVGTYSNYAKYLAAEIAIKAADRAIQTMGGYGFSEEYGVIHHWTSMRLMRTAPVSKEMILSFVSEHVLGLPRSY